jgi:hypothetical protein
LVPCPIWFVAWDEVGGRGKGREWKMCDGNILFLGVLAYTLFTLHPFTPFLVGWCIVDSSVFRDECDDADASYLHFSLTLSCVIRISYYLFSCLSPT